MKNKYNALSMLILIFSSGSFASEKNCGTKRSVSDTLVYLASLNSEQKDKELFLQAVQSLTSSSSKMVPRSIVKIKRVNNVSPQKTAEMIDDVPVIFHTPQARDKFLRYYEISRQKRQRMIEEYEQENDQEDDQEDDEYDPYSYILPKEKDYDADRDDAE